MIGIVMTEVKAVRIGLGGKKASYISLDRITGGH